ncbi:hypothetical protein GCM10009123_21740 [Kangiella japonica]|uniref:NERD domain-containing protein n=1 Tax=Kangiella japonica TaxID=647384 RepID=A0ABN0T790_9GAMM
MSFQNVIIGFSLLFLFGFFSGLILGRFRRYAVENGGEALVRQALVRYCIGGEAHLLSNVTLKLEDWTTTQVDHVLVSRKGIFVIETKHYKGWIFGAAKSKVWTQTIYKEKHKFQNPIHQNYKHVKAVEKLLDFLEPSSIHNIVVFSGEAVFKTQKPNNVFYLKELISAIDGYPDDVLSLNRVQFCVGRLEYQRMALTSETDIEHKANLTRRFGR